MENNKSLLRTIFLERWHPYFWISFVCVALYFKTVAFRLTYFDDNDLIINNYWFLRDIGNVFRAFKETVFLDKSDLFYRPLLSVSFILDAQLGAMSPLVYHSTNIIIHAAASVLVYLLFMRLKYSKKISFFLSILFATHPVLSQAVAWIPGRNDSMLALFVLASFISFISYVENNKKSNVAWHLLFFNLALYTKETAFSLLIICLIYLVLFDEMRFSITRWGAVAAGWAASALLWFTVHRTGAAATQNISIAANGPLVEKFQSLLQYIGKILFPFNLSVFPIARDTTLVYGSIALLVIVLALVLTPRQRLRYSLFGSLWFIVFILPPFLVPIAVRLEHRLYIPILGIFIILIEAHPALATIVPKNVLKVAATAIIMVFAAITYTHSDVFMERFTFWESAVKNSPHSAVAHNKLGVRYIEKPDTMLAAQEFIRSIQLNPQDINGHINLAALLMDQGKYEEAENELSYAKRQRPGEFLIYYHFGLLRYLEGRDAEAESFWKKTIEYNPNYFYVYRTLAAYYYAQGNSMMFNEYVQKINGKFHYKFSLPETVNMKDRKWIYYYSLQMNQGALFTIDTAP